MSFALLQNFISPKLQLKTPLRLVWGICGLVVDSKVHRQRGVFIFGEFLHALSELKAWIPVLYNG